LAEVIGRQDLGAMRNILIRDYEMVPNTNMIGVNEVINAASPKVS
jgi:hypothetical protein